MRSSLSFLMTGVTLLKYLVQEASNRFAISRPRLRVSAALLLCMGCGEMEKLGSCW